ncbi:general substrate transporter [Coniochaeta ligniaria NRRL 30616]|uniref:General substrate transporter n=1 Tax=Coniochaeta ligniaria NRRL 30616 TaxID=1408157 RepID=A0A1J7IRI7_9PEZI|nr:general substrate transporter [Coniochaeta ligniaria NRRL 30616]
MEKDAHSVGQVEDAHAVQVELLHSLRGVAAMEVAQRLEPVNTRSPRMLQLYGICGIMFLAASMLGYDASLMGTLLDFPSFQSRFDASILGAKAGLLSAMFSIGSVCALPFIAPLGDTWGRRVGICVACVLIILGTIVQATAEALPQYLAGRFFLGFGSGVGSVAPAYIVEIAHPALRGVLGGLYNCFYYVGSFLAAIVLRGCVRYSSSTSWLVPTCFQAALPTILLVCCLFFPESPRWLFTHGHTEKCREVITKYHGNDNSDSIYVRLQMREFEEELELKGADKRWWDYRALFKSRSALYRVLICATATPMFAQWTGQASVSYFLPAVLGTSGIKSITSVLNINIGITVASGVAAIAGGSLMDRLGRRKLLIGCCASLVLAWVGMLVCTWKYEGSKDLASAHASVFFIFLVAVIFSFAYTPLQQLYTVECLDYEQRAKGIAFATMMMSAASLVNLFATPIALEQIGWRTYGIWIATCSLQCIFYYFFMVETRGRTLEEMNFIFEQKNPRVASRIRKESVEEAVNMTKVESKTA